jgi:hypothetical protein
VFGVHPEPRPGGGQRDRDRIASRDAGGGPSDRTAVELDATVLDPPLQARARRAIHGREPSPQDEIQPLPGIAAIGGEACSMLKSDVRRPLTPDA